MRPVPSQKHKKSKQNKLINKKAAHMNKNAHNKSIKVDKKKKRALEEVD